MRSRLDSVSQSLAARFAQANSAHKRRAVLAACDFAAAKLGVEHADILSALSVLRTIGHSPDASLRKRLDCMSAESDDEYFRLSDADDASQEDALRAFSEARLASAFSFALSDDDSVQHEALYEAMMSVDDFDLIVKAVEDEL